MLARPYLTETVAEISISQSHLVPYNLPRNPVCAKCGYPSKELKGTRCPECGSALGGAGVVPIGNSVRRKVAILLSAWLFTAVVVFAFLWSPLRLELPSFKSRTFTVVLSGAQSNAYDRVSMQGEVLSHCGWFGSPCEVVGEEWTAVFLRDDVAHATLSANHARSLAVFRADNREHRHVGPFSSALLAEWIKSSFPESCSQAVDLEADAIVTTAHTWLDYAKTGTRLQLMQRSGRRAFRSAGGHGGRSQSSIPSLVTLVIIGYALPVIYVAFLIVRWGRRNLKCLIESSPSSAATLSEST